MEQGGPSSSKAAHMEPAHPRIPSTPSDSAIDVPDSPAPIEVPVDGDYEDDGDSAYGESLSGDDTASLASHITRYRFENGRRYHAYRDGAYWGPNDETHNDQQDIAHHLWLLTLDNQLYLAPIQNPQNILDVGTGTGIWAIDMADKFPAASVTGTDLSPIQPQWVPPNCAFEIDDVTLRWTYPINFFDFVHIREMFGSVGDWDEFFGQAYLHLKPGGYVENVEHSVHPVSDDGTVGPGHIYTQYGEVMHEMGRRRGKDFDVWKDNAERMRRAGFVDVKETRLKWPMGPWSSDPKLKMLGRWNQLRCEQGIEGFVLRSLTNVGGWSYTEVQAFLGKVRAALKDRTVHAYIDVTIVHGRKPFH